MDVSTINYPALIGGLIALAAVIVAMLLKANLTKYTGIISPILNALKAALDAVNGAMPNNEVVTTMIKVCQIAIDATSHAEELWIEGFIEKADRPKIAKDYIDNMLADANITMTPVLESIINCAITLTCYFMPHNRDEE